jgi:fatty acid desaturase
LNYQIEHHLFPRIPRHNLPKVQAQVMPMAKKFNIPYHKTGFISGTMELMRKLYTVSATVKKLQ